MRIYAEDMKGNLEIDTGKLFRYVRSCYKPEDVFKPEDLKQWATEYGYSKDNQTCSRNETNLE